MNYLEMFIAVLAIVLFATIAIVHHRGVQMAADLVTNASHTVQAMQVAHEVLDEIDARLFISNVPTRGLNFSQMSTQYNGTQRFLNLDHYQASFQADISVQNCDNFGVVGTNPAQFPNRLVTVTVYGPPGQRHPVTQSRVYTPFTVSGL